VALSAFEGADATSSDKPARRPNGPFVVTTKDIRFPPEDRPTADSGSLID
jgi:hypothetical protein